MALNPSRPDMLEKFKHLVPPSGYTIKDYLGAGAWKVAFKAASPAAFDVALLCYHADDTKAVAEDVAKLVRLIGTHDFAKYITRVYNIHFDQTNIWIAEELLTEPLSALAPLEDTRSFCEIARDLCRGISYIHFKGLVHRDMKLDNCGLDVDAQIAKIFDVGSVTSEFSRVSGTILTRAPEFLARRTDGAKQRFSKAADVWGLGATLFALRTGTYPFVEASEAAERSLLGELWASRQIDKKAYLARKEDLDASIQGRAAHRQARSRLRAKIERNWSEGGRRLMSEMLSFDAMSRKDIDYFEQEWSRLADDFMAPVTPSTDLSPQGALCDFLRSVETGQLMATPAQIERCGRRVEELKKDIPRDEYDDILNLLSHTKQKVDSMWQEKRAAL